jgi:hypothetical protein
MPASVCLRIIPEIGDDQLSKLGALGPLVAKVTDAFLETRWFWPRKYVALSSFCFMLTDAKATQIDVAHIERLAEELRLKLFGNSDAGDVTLLLFDGNELDTARFVQMDISTLKQAMREPLQPTPFSGQLLKISTAADGPAAMRWRTLEREPDAPTADGGPSASAVEVTFRGIYFGQRQAFVGSSVSVDSTLSPTGYSLCDGANLLPHEDDVAYDLACLAAAQDHLTTRAFAGVLFVPICFAALMRCSTRESYTQQFRAVPADLTRQLAAVVYGVPRAPAFHAFGEIQERLGRHFSTIDLQVEDAGFEIESVPPDSINSVTFRLPDGDERQRTAALRRFMEKRDVFKRRKVWPAITNVRTKAELGACLREQVPFITGQAVCGPLREPVGGLPCSPVKLPLTSTAELDMAS